MTDSERRLSTLIAFVGLLVAFLLGPLNAIVSHVLIRTLPFALGFGCAIWLMAPDLSVEDTDDWNFWLLSTSTATFLFAVLNLAIASLVAVAIYNYGRSIEFYLVASFCGSLLLFLIIFSKPEDIYPPLVLAQIIVFAFILRFSALFFTPGWIGVDIWIHMSEYVANIVSTASMSPLADSKYGFAPIYHLTAAGTTILTGATPRYGLYFSVGLAMVFSLVFVYTLVVRISGVRWALFTAAMFSFSDFVIVWSLHLIPTSLGLLFFLACATLLISAMSGAIEPDSRVSFLLMIFITAVVFTNQVAAFITLIFLLSGVLAQYFLPSKWIATADDPEGLKQGRVINVIGYAVYALGLITINWSMTSWYGQSFLRSALELLISSIQGGGVESRTGVVPEQDYGLFSPATVIPYIDYAGLILLMFGVTIAGLYVIDRWNYLQSHITLLVSGVIMLVFALVPPLFGLRTFLPGRWFAFLYLPFVALTAVALSTIRIQLSSTPFIVIALVFVLIFPGSMIMTSNATLDNPIFENHVPRYAHTGPEMDAMEFTEQSFGDEVVWTDAQFVNNAESYTGDDKYRALYVSEQGEVRVEGEGTHWRLYRDYQTNGTPLWNRLEAGGQHQRQVPPSAVCGNESGHIAYSNEDVTVCQVP